MLASIWHGAPGEAGLLWSYVPAPAGFVRKIDLIDRAHVTRLQAEIAALQQRLTKVLGERDTIYVDFSKANDDALEYMTKMKRAEKECDALQERLNTADQRVDELEALMARVSDHLDFWHDHPYAECLHGVIGDYRKLPPIAKQCASVAKDE